MKNQIFGCWRTIKQDSKADYWICQCLNCNTIKSYKLSALQQRNAPCRRNSKYGCRVCAGLSRMKKYIGQQFSQWTVLGRGDRNVKGEYYWRVKCSCGAIEEKRGSNIKSGSSKCCKVCSKQKHKHSFQWLITFFKHGAIKRNIKFKINAKDVSNLLQIQQYKCALSGITLYSNGWDKNTKKYDSNISIDRIDSNKGYTKNNIQLVVKQVNLMKQQMTQLDFIKMCKLIAKEN